MHFPSFALTVSLCTVLSCMPVRRPTDSALRATPEAAAAEALDAKLKLQFTRFEEARAYLLTEVAEQKQLISRDDWEARVGLAADSAFTAADLAALVARHHALEAAS